MQGKAPLTGRCGAQGREVGQKPRTAKCRADLLINTPRPDRRSGPRRPHHEGDIALKLGPSTRGLTTCDGVGRHRTPYHAQPQQTSTTRRSTSDDSSHPEGSPDILEFSGGKTLAPSRTRTKVSRGPMKSGWETIPPSWSLPEGVNALDGDTDCIRPRSGDHGRLRSFGYPRIRPHLAASPKGSAEGVRCIAAHGSTMPNRWESGPSNHSGRARLLWTWTSWLERLQCCVWDRGRARGTGTRKSGHAQAIAL